jgi:hypothetical protein
MRVGEIRGGLWRSLVSALALEQTEGKAATRTVLEPLAAGKKLPKTARLDVNAAG